MSLQDNLLQIDFRGSVLMFLSIHLSTCYMTASVRLFTTFSLHIKQWLYINTLACERHSNGVNVYWLPMTMMVAIVQWFKLRTILLNIYSVLRLVAAFGTTVVHSLHNHLTCWHISMDCFECWALELNSYFT